MTDKITRRAYSLITIKAVDEEKRIITGTASTPEVDRMGDIVEPEGAQFSLPLPFLWQHNSRAPIGNVTKAKITKSGIEVEVQIAKTDEPGTLKDRLDEAWQSIKLGLVRGLSIGFQSIEFSNIEDGGLRFLKWLWLELSAVTIPANAEASIATIRSLDANRAALGQDGGVVRLETPGASGTQKPRTPKEGEHMKTIAEQIAAWEAKRTTATTRMSEIMNAASEKGETLDQATAEEHDGLAAEVKKINEHIVRLKDQEEINKAAATPAKGGSPDDASRSRGGIITVRDAQLPPGIEFARYAMCLASAKGNLMQAVQIAESRYPEQKRVHEVIKAAVVGGTTTDATWAGALVVYQQFAGDFVEFLRPQTIVGKFGTGAIPSLRRVPFNISIPMQTSGGAAYWVGEGKPKPLTKFDFDRTNLRWAKVANIAVLTDEIVRFSSPSAETLVRDALAAAIIERIDRDFVDPNKSASANVSPASITNGLTPLVSSGDDAAAVRADIQSIFGEFIRANLTPVSGVWIMNANVALALSLMVNALGQPEFPGITMLGGTFQGLPVIVSQYVPTAVVILANASDIYLSDDGQVVIDASREASLQMDDSPTNDSVTPTGTQVVSMFQTNSIAIRAERFINWQRRRDEAVVWMNSVNWNGTAGSGG